MTFLNFLINHSIDIACVTETHLKSDETLRISGYKIYRCDRDAENASGGSAIIIKKNISHHEISLPDLDSIEATAINVTLSNSEAVDIISAYRSPNQYNFRNDMIKLFDKDNPTILFGDINAKNKIWGCRADNNAGKILYHLTNMYNITVSAPREHTYMPFRKDHKSDILDIALLKNFTIPIHHEVYVELDSDHLPVITTFIEPPKIVTYPPRLIRGTVNWEIFQRTLDTSLQKDNFKHLKTESEIDNAVQKYTHLIATSVHKSTTSKIQYRHKPSTPQYILDLIKQKHAARRLWLRYKLQEHKTTLNQLTHRVKWELDNYRVQSYQRYISELQPGDPSMWQATKRLLRQPSIIPPILYDGNVYNSDAEKSLVFASHLESTFSLAPESESDIEDEVITVISRSLPMPALDIDYTTAEEIKVYIKNLPLKKTPGHDLIPNVALKYLTDEAINHLKDIFNSCMCIGYFPTTWKKAEIILFHKPNKPKLSCSSYRPISLLPTMSKILERVIYQRLNEYLNEANIIPPHQFGFRSKHSTTHQLLRLTEMITSGYESKRHTIIAFLDIQQAFDKVWLEGLLFKLHQLNTPGYLLNVISSFLRHRSFSVKIGSSFSSSHQIQAGIPQGSVLGPVLYNIYASDIPTFRHTNIAMFADDTAIISQDYDINVAAHELQQSLNQLNIWCKRWKIKLNPSKCEAKIFTLRRSQTPRNLLIERMPIKWNPDDQAVKYLGVYLDRRLTFGFHINKKLNECHTRLGILYPIINRKSRLKLECSILIYKSIIRPIIMYACVIWSTASKTQITKVQTFQNKVLRIACNSPWFVRNTQIHRETGMPYVKDYINQAAAKFFKCLNNCSGAVHFQLGNKSRQPRLKKRLPQDMLSDSSDTDTDKGNE